MINEAPPHVTLHQGQGEAEKRDDVAAARKEFQGDGSIFM